MISFRVATWFVFRPKIPIWVNFGGPWIGKCWDILCSFGIFYGHLVYFFAIYYCYGNFDIFSLVLVNCVKKNLATPISFREKAGTAFCSLLGRNCILVK
jgi:hypothetical protein